MKDYVESGKWPLAIPGPLLKKYSRTSRASMSRIEYIARKGLHRMAPTMVAPPLPYYYHGNVFRCGTRAWEYPWVLEILSRKEPGQTVLDVGCGSSEFLLQYVERGFQPIGIDHVRSAAHPESELRPEFVREWSNIVRFLDSGADAIPLDSGSVDIVVCLSVMEHIVRRDRPNCHRQMLLEIKRVLRRRGLFICTYDTFVNRRVVFAGVDGWGPEGWYYKDDIEFLEMDLWDPSMPVIDREVINMNEDTFFVPPDLYLSMGYGMGFEEFGRYHRLTSIGFVLVK